MKIWKVQNNNNKAGDSGLLSVLLLHKTVSKKSHHLSTTCMSCLVLNTTSANSNLGEIFEPFYNIAFSTFGILLNCFLTLLDTQAIKEPTW